MNVLIRADASMHIGSGHVMRCLTLASALRRAGHQVVFACRTLPGHVIGAVEADGFECLRLPSGDAAPADIERLIDGAADWHALDAMLAPSRRFDWAVVDHYALDATWERAARSRIAHIAAIDDLANRRHDADVLIDVNLTASAALYQPLVHQGCTLLLGPRYALLRDAFGGGPIAIAPMLRRVLLTFGAVDMPGATLATMRALAAFPLLEADIVAGAANPHWHAIQAEVAKHPNWRLHKHVADFASLMRQCDLCIGAGGGTTWERAALGLPTICIAVARNQEANAQCLAAAGAIVYLGPIETVGQTALHDAIYALHDARTRAALAEAAHRLVDGRGAHRVAATLQDAMPRPG